MRIVPSLSMNADAANDLRQLMATDKFAAGKIAALLQQAKHDPKIIASLPFIATSTTKKTMTSLAVSVKLTTNSDSPSIRLVEDEPRTSTSKCQVMFKEFSPPQKPFRVLGAIDIDDLVAELEREPPENAKAIAHGR